MKTATARVTAGGFASLSIHGLAKDLGYTPGALYRYYPSKDALIAGLVARVVRLYADHMTVLIDQLEGAPLPRLLACLLGYRAMADAMPNRFGMLTIVMAEARILVPKAVDMHPIMAATQAALQPLMMAFIDAIAQGKLAPAPPFERAMSAFGVMQGLLLLRKPASRVSLLPDTAKLTRDTLRALLSGWGATSEALDEAFARLDALGPLAPSTSAEAP